MITDLAGLTAYAVTVAALVALSAMLQNRRRVDTVRARVARLRALKGGSATVLFAVAFIGLGAGVVFAHHPVVVGVTECRTGTTWTVNWTASADAVRGLTWTIVTPGGYTPTGVLTDDQAFTRTGSYPDTEAVAVETVTALWSNGVQEAATSSVVRPPLCVTDSTTTVPEQTTTTVPASTTTLEATTTSTVEPSTTSTVAATTSTALTATSEVATTTTPTTTTPPPSTVPPTSPPGAAPSTGPPDIPVTGDSVDPYIVLVLLAAGSFLALLARREPAP